MSNLKAYYRHVNRRLLRKIKCQKMNYQLERYRSPHSHIFYAPNNWKWFVIEGNTRYLYLVSKFYFFGFSIPNTLQNLKVCKQSSAATFYSQITLPDTKLTLKLLSSLASTFSSFFFLKLKFKGKGYYLYKNIRNTITPQFGYAHRIYKYNYFTSVKFLSKTKVFFFGTSKNDLFYSASSVKAIRPINIFTGRGVRFAKTVIYKKTGKVSSYR